MKKFFSTNDDFNKIIEDIIGDFENIEQISTGWTNFVFKVSKNKENYIFRFPRNTFFSNAIEKEAIFSEFIHNKVDFETPLLKLHFHNNRPFSQHKEIKGNNMQQLYSSLTKQDKINIAKQVSKFIYQLQQIDISSLQIELPTTSTFLKELSKVDNQVYDMNKLNPLIELEKKELVLSHADLNPGNILLDQNYNVCGILDFAFVSLTYSLNDMARLIGRLPNDYYQIMLNAYNEQFKTKINKKEIDDIISVWNHVEYHYMIYMKNNHPEIRF